MVNLWSSGAWYEKKIPHASPTHSPTLTSWNIAVYQLFSVEAKQSSNKTVKQPSSETAKY